MIVRDPSAKVALGEAMRRCRVAIPLKLMGIKGVIPKRTMTKDLMIQIPGPDMVAKANLDAMSEDGGCLHGDRDPRLSPLASR